MREEEIRKYASLMQELGLSALEVEGERLRLERGGAAAAAAAIPTSPAQPAAPAEDCTVVRSPMVGVFYAAPAENAEPYVAIGDRIEQGSTLCIIEAMKLMNEITAEQSGVITEICVTNGQVVEYGTELFRIRRTA